MDAKLHAVVTAAIQVAADGPLERSSSRAPERTFIRRELLDDLREALDRAYLGHHWGEVQEIQRAEERTPA